MISTFKRTAVCVFFVILASHIASAQIRLNGAGATLPAPLYQEWIATYQKNHAGVQIDYEPKGSGAGISEITDKTIDFAGSDAPMTKKEIAKAGGNIVQIPATAGAVVLAYNIPGFNGELNLSGPVLADIFAGKITNWNDPKLAELNPGAALPDLAITPIERGDSSGTNFVFTSYLSTQSDDFRDNIGHSKTVNWPAGQLGQQNDGVTSLVHDNKGAIGYIELNYALANNIPFANIKNKDGKFVKPSTNSVASASTANAAAANRASLTRNIWNQSGADVYPISTFTYIILYKDLDYLKDQTKARTLVDFLTWATTDGQRLSAAAGYAPLSVDVQKKVGEVLSSLTYGGQPLKKFADVK